MSRKKILFFAVFVLVSAVKIFSQAAGTNAGLSAADSLVRLQGGINLYTQGKWNEAIAEFRWVLVESPSRAQKIEAVYWRSLAELASGNYTAALRDMEAVEKAAPRGRRARELPYHKGRALYYLGRYEESIAVLSAYAASAPASESALASESAPAAESGEVSGKAAALYWTAECFYSLGRLDRAAEIFALITTEYPRSHKYEVSFYRIALIKQRKVEAGLLELLKAAREESARTMEEYNQMERAYNEALAADVPPIDETPLDGMSTDTRLSDLESEYSHIREELNTAEERIRSLENELKIALVTGPVGSSADTEREAEAQREARLRAMRTSVLELKSEIEKSFPESGR